MRLMGGRGGGDFPITEINTILVFSTFITFLPRRVNSFDTVQRYFSQSLRALVDVTAHQNKIPSVAIIAINPSTKPTPLISC
jgi:hypothetical protein